MHPTMSSNIEPRNSNCLDSKVNESHDIPSHSNPISKNRATEKDEDEFPEGGWGWMVVAGCFILMGTSFGMINSYGQYQKYYLTLFPDESQSLLTLMGSLQAFTLYMFSIPAAILLQKLGPRSSILVSAVITSFSFMMTSLCKQVWQLALAQGIIFGIGTSMPVLVCYSVPQQWFKRRRATAIGFVSSGSSIGGIVWPLAIQNLTRQVGYPWTNRIIGFIYLPLLGIAALLIRTREHEIGGSDHIQKGGTSEKLAKASDCSSAFDKEQCQIQMQRSEKQRLRNADVSKSEKGWIRHNILHSKFLIDWTVLKDYRFCIILFANFIGFFTLFIPLFFLPSYATLVRISPVVQNNILTITNAASVLGRILPGVLGDKIGRLNAFIIAALLSGIFVLALWIPAKNEPLVLLTGILFGLSSGAFVALPPAVIGQLFGIKDIKYRLSLYMLVCAPGSLVGTVIGGAFLPTAQSSNTNTGTQGYINLIVFSGVLFLGCAFILIIARLCFSRKLFAFV